MSERKDKKLSGFSANGIIENIHVWDGYPFRQWAVVAITNADFGLAISLSRRHCLQGYPPHTWMSSLEGAVCTKARMLWRNSA